MNIDEIRKDFPLLSRKIDGTSIKYLDSAATSLTPNTVIETISNYYSNNSSNIHRGKHYLSEEVSSSFEDSRTLIAQFLGCFSDEVIFTPNATASINIVANGLGLNEGDCVLACIDSHHSNYLPWLNKPNTHIIRLDSDGLFDLNHFEELMIYSPKLVAITHCSNVTGVFSPIKEIIEIARKNGALILVDAAQSIPHYKFDVANLDVDFLAFSAHKMLGPTGIGVLYGKKESLMKLTPTTYGGGIVDWVENKRFKLRKLPHNLEAGTPNISGVLGFSSAIQYLNRIGMENIMEYDKYLSDLIYGEADKRNYLDILIKKKEIDRSAIFSFSIRDCKNTSEIARALSDSYGFMCRSGHLCAQPLVDSLTNNEVIRISAYLYNKEEEIIDFFSALDEICMMYGYK